jgi:hypothetical protein
MKNLEDYRIIWRLLEAIDKIVNLKDRYQNLKNHPLLIFFTDGELGQGDGGKPELDGAMSCEAIQQNFCHYSRISLRASNSSRIDRSKVNTRLSMGTGRGRGDIKR